MAGSQDRDTEEVRLAERRRQALELRRSGATYQQIADALGYDTGTAFRDVQRAIADIPKEPAKAVLQQELDRLDAMLAGLWPAATKGEPAAVQAAMKLMDRRARYLGLDAPVKSSVDAAGGLAAFLAQAFPAAVDAPALPAADDETE